MAVRYRWALAAVVALALAVALDRWRPRREAFVGPPPPGTAAIVDGQHLPLTTSPPQQRVRRSPGYAGEVYMAPAGELPVPRQARGATWLTGDDSLNQLYWTQCRPTFLGELSWSRGEWAWDYWYQLYGLMGGTTPHIFNLGSDSSKRRYAPQDTPAWRRGVGAEIAEYVKQGAELPPWLRRGPLAEVPEVRDAIQRAIDSGACAGPRPAPIQRRGAVGRTGTQA